MTIITAKNLSAYGFIALPIAFAGFPLYILAPDFYASEYGVSLTALGTVLLILRLIDGLQDPLLGAFADKYHHYMKYILIISGLFLSISFYAVFHPLSNPLLWFSITMLIAISCYSLLFIIISAMGSLWSAASKDQNSICFSRESFGLVGLLLAVTLPSILSQNMSLSRAYLWLWVILTICFSIGSVLFYRWFKAHIHRPPMAMKKSIFTCLKQAPKEFLFIYAISTLSSSITAVLVIFFVRDLLGAETYFGLFLFIYFLSSILCMGVWNTLSGQYGKYPIWLLSMILGAITFIWAYFLEDGDILSFGIICMASGAISGANLMIPPSILGDYIHENHLTQNASSYYAFLSFIAKATLGVASIMALPFIEYFGFIAGQENGPVALHSLSVAYVLIPCILRSISAGLLWYCYIYPSKRK